MMNLFIASENASESPFDIDFLTLGTAIVVFVIFLLLASKLVWPHIIGGLDQREQKLRDDLEAAEEARIQAKAALGEYEDELKKARTEAGEMIAKARQDAKAAAEELRSNNTRELAEMKSAATADINAAKKAAIGELHSEASNLAVEIAGRILDREISAEDQEALLTESLAEMGQTK
ncbi:MAG: F0F1 ATP synthase subunit B [Phycisphaerales bacterium]|jgi:F-type H+-transporting ATPase subunit b|nr:F0F1 ATP synthase subunit B [Phycisphaerales bacterium]|tara:strand:+ start:148 stop:678 length:531 start_codon:yes stop_codon:yes gene_type:complete